MGYTWNQTKHEGVRYREHPTRKHGVRPDQYFVIRYRVEGKRREEALGWASQGWTAAKAAQALAKLQEAARTGEGCVTLAEKRKQAEARREQERQEEEARARDLVTFGQIFHDSYMPAARLNKSKVSCDKEDGFYRNWIGGVLGDKPLVEIAPFDLERLKKVMLEAGKSPKTTHYCLAVVRQVFNFAKRNGLFHGDNPVAFVKKPTADNRRLRFLTHDEADRLLSALADRSPDVHSMALLSLHCGLRAGEIFSLTWQDVDLGRGVLTLRDTKSGKCRAAIMTDVVKDMLSARQTGRLPSGLVFPSRTGERIVEMSNTFQLVADGLGLNNGVIDRRQKVVFHTLRHSFASWLVEQGVDLYTVKELMGHGTLAMTERYSHLSPDKLRRAVKTLEAGMEKAARNKKVVHLGDR
ncbi:tyrosine-type recombinase/integrase [Solidesulfovibrio alcoholivorans]|uniref:tyrosine-type recombinase/integrase n=1 Tax=Solidesulfovibrio alcoholivorans TaxID=81406 RepID=UPI000494DF08|nr:site-specific integrase [Solidesulfovibrio alcoholivorans]